MKWIFGFSAGLALVFFGSVLHAKPATAPQINELLKLTEADRLGEQVLQQMMMSLQAQGSSLPESFWANLKKDIDVGGLQKELIPIYQKHLTEEDAKGLIAFYKSPVGQKFIRVTPLIVQESMDKGQAWGERVAEIVIKRMQEEESKKIPPQSTPNSSKP
jgi:hypothetical protein